jgi:hypothetical protein
VSRIAGVGLPPTPARFGRDPARSRCPRNGPPRAPAGGKECVQLLESGFGTSPPGLAPIPPGRPAGKEVRPTASPLQVAEPGRPPESGVVRRGQIVKEIAASMAAPAAGTLQSSRNSPRSRRACCPSVSGRAGQSPLLSASGGFGPPLSLPAVTSQILRQSFHGPAGAAARERARPRRCARAKEKVSRGKVADAIQQVTERIAGNPAAAATRKRLQLWPLGKR